MFRRVGCRFDEQCAQAVRSENSGPTAEGEEPGDEAFPLGSYEGKDEAVVDLLLFDDSEPPFALCRSAARGLNWTRALRVEAGLRMKSERTKPSLGANVSLSVVAEVMRSARKSR